MPWQSNFFYKITFMSTNTLQHTLQNDTYWYLLKKITSYLVRVPIPNHVICFAIYLLSGCMLMPWTNIHLWDFLLQKAQLHRIIQSYNHRIVWVERDLEDHLDPTTLQWAGARSTTPGSSKPHPIWLWTLTGMGHPHLLWANCSSLGKVFHHPHGEEFIPNV